MKQLSNVYLGLFDTIEAATKARRDAERKHGFFGAHGKRKSHMSC